MRQPVACAKQGFRAIATAMMTAHISRWILPATAGLLLGACGGQDTPPAASPQPGAPSSAAISGGSSASCLSRAYPEIGGPIDLIDQDGKSVTQDDYAGQSTLVFFGFTYCPDVCPMTLVTLKRAYDRLPDGVTPPQTLLISVDPERDTPQELASYIKSNSFPDNLTGLTGTPNQVRAAADAFIADYSRIEQPDSTALYTMDHTSLIYLMDENWQLKTFFTHEDTDETIGACLTEVLK